MKAVVRNHRAKVTAVLTDKVEVAAADGLVLAIEASASSGSKSASSSGACDAMFFDAGALCDEDDRVASRKEAHAVAGKTNEHRESMAKLFGKKEATSKG